MMEIDKESIETNKKRRRRRRIGKMKRIGVLWFGCKSKARNKDRE